MTQRYIMNKFKIHTTSIFITALLLIWAFFGIAQTEARKQPLKTIATKQSSSSDNQSVLINEIARTEEAYQRYLKIISDQRNDFRDKMAAAEKEYNQLLNNQASLIASQQKTIAVTKQQTIPVITTTKTTVKKPVTKTTTSQTAVTQPQATTPETITPQLVAPSAITQQIVAPQVTTQTKTS